MRSAANGAGTRRSSRRSARSKISRGSKTKFGIAEWRSRSISRSIVRRIDRKSTRLNSSHVEISYAVFCLKKKKDQQLLNSADFLTVVGGARAAIVL